MGGSTYEELQDTYRWVRRQIRSHNLWEESEEISDGTFESLAYPLNILFATSFGQQNRKEMYRLPKYRQFSLNGLVDQIYVPEVIKHVSLEPFLFATWFIVL